MTVVAVPAFNAPEATRRCLEALEATLDERQPVIVIDDASDDPAIGELFAALPRQWTQVRNETNLGFVASANLGMTMASGQDVILLNADTQVTHGWLAALEHGARRDERIASATPLTNNGEIASIPEFCRANPWPDDPERWARACRQAGPAVYPLVPTAVGFCIVME